MENREYDMQAIDNDYIKEYFSKSYGELYRGNKAFDEYFLKYATEIIKTNEAMAIIIGLRIAAVATKPESDSRMGAMVELLNKCKRANIMNWITVGVQYDSMKYACEQANMISIDNKQVIQHLLNSSTLEAGYQIIENNLGIYVAKETTPNYKQVVYL